MGHHEPTPTLVPSLSLVGLLNAIFNLGNVEFGFEDLDFFLRMCTYIMFISNPKYFGWGFFFLKLGIRGGSGSERYKGANSPKAMVTQHLHMYHG